MLCSFIICLKNCHGFCFVIVTTEKWHWTLKQSDALSHRHTQCIVIAIDSFDFHCFRAARMSASFFARIIYFINLFCECVRFHSLLVFKRVICIGVLFAGHNDDDDDFFRVFFSCICCYSFDTYDLLPILDQYKNAAASQWLSCSRWANTVNALWKH